MNIMFTKSKPTGGLLSRALLLLAFVLGTQYGANAQTNNPSPYCGASHQYTSSSGQGSCYYGYGWHFKWIKLGTIDHKPKCTTSGDGYRFWNNGPTTTLSPGATYTLTLQIESTNYNVPMMGWIDFNGDLSFQANEAVTPSWTGTSAVRTVDFTVPCSAKPGKTRLRVRCDYYYAWNASQGCTPPAQPYGYGETHDYEITIATAGNPTANFFLPDSIFTQSPANFINANKTGYITHNWSTSVAGLGTVVGTGTNFQYAFPAPGNYQVRVTSTNCTGSATTTKNVTVVDPTTPPTVRFIADRTYINSDASSGEIVNFSDFSTSGPTGYLWEITPDQFTSFWFEVAGSLGNKDVSIFFTEEDRYDVCMTASNMVGSSKLCKPQYVIIEAGGGTGYENNMCEVTKTSLDSGIIYDPGGKDGKYTQPAGCTMEIEACDADRIEFWFEGTMYLYYYAWVRLYDGVGTSGEQIFNLGLGGNGIYSTTPSTHWFVNNSRATVEFFNQYSGYSSDGFELHYKVHKRNDGPLRADFNILNTRNDSVYSCQTGTEVRFTNTTSGTRDIDPNDYQWIFDFDPNIAYPPGYEDMPYNNDKENATYIYSQDKTYTVRLVAKSCEGWDTTYKTFHINTTNMLPNVDFEASERILLIGQPTKLMNRTIAWCDGDWEISPADYELLNGSSLSDQDIEVSFKQAGRYTVKYIAENDNGTATRSKTDYIRVIDYCEPNILLPSPSMSISRVQLNTIDNVSTTNANGFEDFTKLTSTDLYVGSTYQLDITRDAGVADFADKRVWIDFDRDGMFSATELVAQDNNTKALMLSTNVTIPASAVAGASRMRIAISLAGKAVTSCGPIDAGEYEDYSVNLRLDDVPPVITMNGADTVYVEVGSTYTDAGATANDNREGNITSRMVTNNQVDVNQTGIYVVTYDVKDLSGLPAIPRRRFVFVLADMTAPVVTITGNGTLTHNVKTPYVDPGATALDNPGANDITNLIVTNNMVNENVLGTYDVEYMVTDAYGNSATAKRSVEVVDVVAPVINATGGNPMVVQVNSTFVDPTTVTDNYYNNVPFTVISGSVDTKVFGQYTVKYGAVDGSGNVAAEITRTYIVTDAVPPVLSSLSGTEFMVVDVNDLNFVEPAVTGTDNFFSAVNVTRNDGGFNISQLGSYNITYTGTDGAGNTTTWVRTIKVVDRIKPVVISTPVNIQRWSVFNDKAGVSTWDNYYAPAMFISGSNNCKIEVVSSNVNMLQVGLYQVIYQAVDGSGNVSDPHMRLVNVVENTTGVSEVLENAINIYPNPTTGKFDVDFGVAVTATTTITISNIAGQTVRTFGADDVVNNKLTVDLSDVAAGVYFVQIQSEGSVATKKVTISR